MSIPFLFIKRFFVGVFLFFFILFLWALWSFWSFLPFVPVLWQNGTVLIMLHNNAEMRPTLGFLTGFFLLKNEGNGRTLEFHDSYDVRPQNSPKEAPELLQKRFGNTDAWEGWVFRDSNMSFLFSENAKNAIDFLTADPRYADLRYTAVIGVDMQAVGEIIDAVGGVSYQGKTLTSESLFSVLSSESRTFIPLSENDWLNRKSGLSDLSSALIKALILKPWKWDNVSNKLKDTLDNQHILLWFAEDYWQENAKKHNWTGEMTILSEKILPYGTFFTNLGGKKSDRYLKKNITSTFSVNDFGDIQETVQLSFSHFGVRNVFSDRYFAEVALIRPNGIRIEKSKGSFEYPPEIKKDGTIRFFFWVDHSSNADFTLHLTYPKTISASFVDPLSFQIFHQPGTNDALVHTQMIFQGIGQTSFGLSGCVNAIIHENISFCQTPSQGVVNAEWKADTTPPFLEELVWQNDRKTLRVQLSEPIDAINPKDIRVQLGGKTINPTTTTKEPMAVMLHFSEALEPSKTEKYLLQMKASDVFGNSGMVNGAIR